MNIALIDYGTGNLHSLEKALESGGARVVIQADPAAAANADAIVLPGVGAFGAAAAQLAAGAAALKEAIRGGKPCLGICLGMQLLFDASEEGAGAGLGALPGHVRRLHARRLPHMGWNDIDMVDDPLFTGIDSMLGYYANSFAVVPEDESDVIAWTQYGGERFPAAVRRDNVWGVQFHPEKSGATGLRLLNNFLAQVPA
ncbi:MAG TPA: imidazole glycerol phosphate synthase subunit HisH [Longimicrobiales bacterium]|nr:imidazole glycerol phosphate synthase subunit HisH [Longimicrobiales bacterium]